MSTLSRGNKTSGGVNFATGNSILASEVNTDFNNITSWADEGVGNDNIDPDAAIDPTKIDDYSVNAAEADNEVDPGATGSESLATDLTGEFDRLRYQIHALIDANASATYWGDVPYSDATQLVHPNMLRNGGFELYTTTTANDPPDGWSDSGDPDTVEPIMSAVAAANVDGSGASIHIVDNDADNVGLTQQIPAGALRASSDYLVRVRAKCTNGGTEEARLTTTGAGTEITSTVTSSTSWATLEGVFTTDATPSAVSVNLLVGDSGTPVGGDVHFDRCRVQPKFSVEKQPQGNVVAVTSLSTATSEDSGVAEAYVNDGTDNLITNVVVPSYGYYIKVLATVSFLADEIDNAASIVFRMRENTTTTPATVSTGTVRAGTAFEAPNASVNQDASTSMVLQYVDTNPTPGTRYFYHVTYEPSADSNMILQPSVDSVQTVSNIVVEAVRYG